MSLTPEQMEIRRLGIGSSEIAAIAGVHPYMSALDVWLSKFGQDFFEGNERTEEGEEMEAAIARVAARRLGVRITKGTTVIYPPSALVVATPDYYEHPGPGDAVSGVMEIKRVGSRVVHHWRDDDDREAVPEYVHYQWAWQAGAVGVQAGHVAADLAGYVKLFDLAADPALFDDLLTIADEWWRRHIVERVQPEVDGSEKARAYLRRRFEKLAEATVAATWEEDALAKELLAIKARLRADEAREKELTNRLWDRIKTPAGEPAAAMAGDGWRVKVVQKAGIHIPARFQEPTAYPLISAVKAPKEKTR